MVLSPGEARRIDAKKIRAQAGSIGPRIAIDQRLPYPGLEINKEPDIKRLVLVRHR